MCSLTLDMFFEDSLPSDDFDNDEIEDIILMVVAKELEKRQTRKRHRSQMGRQYIPQNRASSRP